MGMEVQLLSAAFTPLILRRCRGMTQLTALLSTPDRRLAAHCHFHTYTVHSPLLPSQEPIGFFLTGLTTILSYLWYMHHRAEFTWSEMHQRMISGWEVGSWGELAAGVALESYRVRNLSSG